MRSSISSSKPAALFYAKVLVGICALLILSAESLSNYLLKLCSETYARISQQYADAIKVRPAKPDEPISVLMVGNSLLLEGVEVDRLRKLTSGRIRIYPVFLEATGYYDWLYGLRRLFREGSRPQVVVLGLGVDSFLANGVRQDYAPLMFFDAQDILSVASDLKMDNTATSNVLLAHSSVFWDIRGVIRTQILRHTIPHCRELFSLLQSHPAIPPAPEFATIAKSRLERLRQLCEAHGSKLIILIPPTPSSEDAVRRMLIASQMVGADTLVPIDPTVLSATYYQPNDIHLNRDGAKLFTSALATCLRKKIVMAEPVT